MLKKRLATLRRESGAAATPSPNPATAPPTDPPIEPPSESVSARLRRHGRRPAGRRRTPASDDQLAEQLGADILSPGLLCVDRHIPLHHQHGDIALHHLLRPPTRLPLSPDIPQPVAPSRLLLFDTETTGLSGGVGTLAFMVGMARLDGERLWVRQLLISALSAEPAMLAQAAQWAGAAEACVSYNGLSFDLPLLAARYRLNGREDRFSPSGQIDLLHPTRRAFARPWGHCRLADVERRLLRFQRHDDLPGSEAPIAWLNWLQRGDSSLLAGVLRHNHWDLLSLAALLPTLDQVYADPARHHADLGAIARHWSNNGQPQRAQQLLQRHQRQLDRRGQLQLAWHYRQNRQWPQACALWQPLAERGDTVALEALAKYHEHQCREFQQALDYTLRLPPSAQRERRCLRLSKRLQSRASDHAQSPLQHGSGPG